jgi:hypothetical protein
MEYRDCAGGNGVVDVITCSEQRNWYKVHVCTYNGQRPLVGGEAMEVLWSFPTCRDSVAMWYVAFLEHVRQEAFPPQQWGDCFS